MFCKLIRGRTLKFSTTVTGTNSSWLSVTVPQQNKLIFHGSNEHGGHGWPISQAKEQRRFPHTVVSPKRRPCTAWHGAAQGHTRETIYDAVTPAQGVIYSLICCGNGQRIITCKILINVLQQQTSFAKLVICCSAPDSEQLN